MGMNWCALCTVQYVTQPAHKYRTIATKLILVITNGCDKKETQIGVFTIFFMHILMTHMYIKHRKELQILGIIEKYMSTYTVEEYIRSY
jgi:hypothetical protein